MRMLVRSKDAQSTDELSTELEALGAVIEKIDVLHLELQRLEIKFALNSRLSHILESLAAGRPIDFYEAVNTFERLLIKTALDRAGGVQAGACTLLNLGRSTINTKIKNLRISAKFPTNTLLDKSQHNK